MKVYLSNAFSLSMLPERSNHIFDMCTTEVPVEAIIGELDRNEDFISVVGHETTADLFSKILGRLVLPNQQSIVLEQSDVLIVGQYSGPRLPEGATELPEGAKIRWFFIDF